jgi:HPt (histidine-containing phosphotransfer) domain-containing protein
MEKPNLSYINQLANGNQEFKNEVISVFKRELITEIETYNDSITKKNLKATAEIVHKLKNKISLLSLEKSYYIAQDFENNLKNNSITLHKEFEEILEIMNDFVKKL